MLLSVTITPISAVTVITVDEAKKHCHVDFDTWDNDFYGWIRAATEALQVFTGLVFVPSVVKAVYRKRILGERVQLDFNNNASEPSYSNISAEMIGSVAFETYTATYTAGDEPKEWMKQAVKMYVADLFAQRGESDLTDWNANAKIRVGERAKQYCKSFISHGYWF